MWWLGTRALPLCEALRAGNLVLRLLSPVRSPSTYAAICTSFSFRVFPCRGVPQQAPAKFFSSVHLMIRSKLFLIPFTINQALFCVSLWRNLRVSLRYMPRNEITSHRTHSLCHWMLPRVLSRMICDLHSHRKARKVVSSHLGQHMLLLPTLLVTLMDVNQISLFQHTFPGLLVDWASLH